MNALGNITMVSASAGTGKTYTLTQLIAGKVSEGVPASGIMATTFTRKAAGELRERIAAKLLDAPSEGQDLKRLRDAAQQLSVSLIGTVNSVCGRLLTEYAIDAGLSPEVEVIAEEQQVAMFRLATDGVLAEYSDRVLPIARRLSQLDSDGAWDQTVRNICDAARNNLLLPSDLAHCAALSWEGLQELLDERSATDDRAVWRHQFRQDLDELLLVADTGVDSTGKTVKTTGKNFTGTWPIVQRRISGMADLDTVSWNEWRRVLPASNPVPAVWISKLLEGSINTVEDGLTRNPAFQDDLEQYIKLVFECAATCLATYAEFKHQHGLMDFVDQETLMVSLVRDNEAFRASFRQRVKYLVVDEFQDTSPLQLELFLQLSRLVEECVWVGDPKQAIFEFRGTDPELMNEVVANVDKTNRLHESWRSQQAVVDLSNAVFAPVFTAAGMSPESVRLGLPAAHAHWPSGTLEAWTMPGSDGDHIKATAAGVVDLLARRPELKPSDIAVLARSNAEVAKLARALTSIGLRASANEESLLAAREIQLVRAAMAFVADGWDTVALTEIVALHPEHSAHWDWQLRLLGSADASGVLEEWAAEGIPAALAGLRDRAGRATPTEVFEEVVNLLGLPDLIKSWSAPPTRLRNLDAFRACLRNYYESCSALKEPATLRGCLGFLNAQEQLGADNVGEDVVNVLTYHKAKGLEWPVVVMGSLDKASRSGAFGVAIEQSGTFSLVNPLAGRWIRFWPNPFDTKGSALEEQALASEVQARAEERDRRNQARLMYVGMTRSIQTTVLTSKTTVPKGLNLLGVPDLISWAGTDVDAAIHVAGAEPLPATVYSYEPVEPNVPALGSDVGRYTDRSPQGLAADFPRARIQASSQSSEASPGQVLAKADLGDRIVGHGAAGWDAVGSAIHAYLGTAYEVLSADEQLGLAKQIIDRWGVADRVDAETLVSAGHRLADFLEQSYPDGTPLREVPLAWRNELNQVMEGWIDLLIETPTGYVLIDHKSYPGNEPAQHIRDEYLGQMQAYEDAVFAATGRTVAEKLIHLPALGKVYQIVSN